MKYFYKIDDGKLIRGSGTKIPDSFTEYSKDNPPEDFLEIYNQELLESTKDTKKKELVGVFNEILGNGYTCSNGIKLDAPLEDINNLQGDYDYEFVSGGTSMVVRDYNNVNQEIPLEDVADMLLELRENYNNNLKTLWYYKDLISNSTDIEEVTKITWEDINE